MVVLIIFVTAVTAFVGVALWYGSRAELNTGPALGTNRPYPEGYGSDEPPYLPTPFISEDEEFRRDAHRILGEGRHGPPPSS